MEDCYVLNEFMDQYGDENLDKVLPAFSEFRSVDGHAICDLAMYNYIEVRIFLFLFIPFRTRFHVNHIFHVDERLGQSMVFPAPQTLRHRNALLVSQLVDSAIHFRYVFAHALSSLHFK
jgi:hypothetical protein